MDDKQENLSRNSLSSKLLSIDEELWRMIEERTQEILWIIEPNILSELNRKNVINYVQKLIEDYFHAQIVPFGSFPLKTYLPDGDIDLTILTNKDEEKNATLRICAVIENDNNHEYQIKDVDHIQAQVEVVKCTVKNIPIDISFNQMAGLHTLFFLEQVDQFIGKNHIFKQSIIFIKAWCYYEGRLLGSHHGLLSSYAIEILVLYIINHFHSSVRGPLDVLYIFLDYYSSFDWEYNYVTIWGPKPLSSLPEIVECDECDEFLLKKDFVENYRNMCSSKVKASETRTNEFHVKNMNILDPLRNDNNLGRSINSAGFHRIRLALSYGAKMLKKIFELPGENMGSALENFFSCTLERNGKGEREDVDFPVSPFGIGRSEKIVLDGDCDAMPVTTVHSNSPSSTCQDHIVPLPAQQNWSGGHHHLAFSTQPNWNMYYQRGSGVFIPRPFNPTYTFQEGRRSRGTGTYIPSLDYNSYWDIQARMNRSMEFPTTKHDELLKRQQAEELHSEENMNENSKQFELSNEDFPLLPDIRNASTEKVHSEIDKEEGGSSRLSVEANPSTQAEEPAASLAKVLSKTNKDSGSSSFELSEEDFPILQRTHK